MIALLAVVIYAFFWLLQRRGKGGGPQVIERGPVGPDDDEDFLRELEWRRQKERREREKRSGQEPEDPGSEGETGRPDAQLG